jgi:hypothetical protein
MKKILEIPAFYNNCVATIIDGQIIFAEILFATNI